MSADMKFTISRDALKGLLAAVSGAAPTRTTLPVLKHVLLEAEDDTLRATCTDLDLMVRSQAAARVSAPGTALVPVEMFRQIADKLAQGDVELELSGLEVTIKGGRARQKLHCLPVSEFPKVAFPDFSSAWTVPAEILFSAIEAVAFAVSTEEVRPILNGVHWHVNGSELRMVATNGHRLALAVAPAPDGAAAVLGANDVIVRPRALALARALLAGSHTIEIARTDNYLAFRSGSGTVATRLVEGPYPNYEQVIPTDNDKVLVADCVTLRQAVERMAVLAGGSDLPRLNVTLEVDAPIQLAARNPDRGSGEEDVPAVSYEGDLIGLEFNAQYVSDLLKKVGTERCRWSFRTPVSPTLLEPVDQKGGIQTRYLLMPVREPQVNGKGAK